MDEHGGEITYRRATHADAEETYRVVRAATDDLDRRSGRQVSHGLPADRVIRYRHVAVDHDGDRFWVAEADGHMVGSAIANLREDVWYLAALHVLPAYQSRRVGTELIRRALAGTGPGTARTVLTDAINPVSNGLYMRHGMLPQDSVLSFDGPLEGAVGDEGPFTVRSIELPDDHAVLAELDRGSVGFARPVDHEFWASVRGLRGVLLVAGGLVAGYAYVSDTGAIGPVATHRPAEIPAALDACLEIAREAGATALHLRTNGVDGAAARWAVDRGLRVSGIGLMLSSRPVGRLDRYVTSGADALY